MYGFHICHFDWWNFKLVRFSWEQNLPKAKWISMDSLGIAFHVNVYLKVIADVISLQPFCQKYNFVLCDKILCKHYSKWNAYRYPSKYWMVLKCSRNETLCEKNLFSCWFQISNWYKFILLFMWMNSQSQLWANYALHCFTWKQHLLFYYLWHMLP